MRYDISAEDSHPMLSNDETRQDSKEGRDRKDNNWKKGKKGTSKRKERI